MQKAQAGPTAQPAAGQSGPGYAKHPGYRIDFAPCAKRVRAVFNGETVADSTAVRLLHETAHIPVYYFPREDLRPDLLTRTTHSSYCPFKGEASYWSLSVGDRVAENAVWSYEAPYREVADIKDYMAFYWNRMDRWFEEDEEVFVHARDPYVRLDVLPSSRPVRIVAGGEVVAESARALFLFETGLPTRYYIPREDVRQDLLVASDSHTACPYKGTASYHSLKLGDRLMEDIVWFYPEPVREVTPIRDHLCFYNEKVDAVVVDGVEQPKPKTKWS